MLPVTVQFVVAMLAYTLNERMARKAGIPPRGEPCAQGGDPGRDRHDRDPSRSLLAPVDGLRRHATHLIHDRDPLFTAPSARLAGARSAAR
jgi:hypothetical protein